MFRTYNHVIVLVSSMAQRLAMLADTVCNTRHALIVGNSFNHWDRTDMTGREGDMCYCDALAANSILLIWVRTCYSSERHDHHRPKTCLGTECFLREPELWRLIDPSPAAVILAVAQAVGLWVALGIEV